MIGGVFYFIGISLAGYAGYSDFKWYFIFYSSLIMAVGYFIIRAPQINGYIAKGGLATIPKLLIMQIIGYSIITTPVYFIAAFFSA